MERMSRWLGGGGFPTFSLALLATYELLLLLVLLLPAQGTPMEAFAADFRVWCYGLDPATGRYQWSYVMAMTSPPWMMAAFIAMVWWSPLQEVRRQPGRLIRNVVPAVSLVTAAALAMVLAADPTAQDGELPFPAEALRTHHRAPAIQLVDHTGVPVDLADEQGRVVVVTAVYSHCVATCPVILNQVKAAVAALDPELVEDLRVVGVTLDPGRDDPAQLAKLVKAHGLEQPLFRLATGEVEVVEKALDDIGVARTRDPETGVIDHANLFLVIDRQGQVAYRFTIGERQERWLTQALQLLLAEARDLG